jgi:hypothetical protein
MNGLNKKIQILKQMTTYLSHKNNEIQKKKVIELENYNHGLMKILDIQKVFIRENLALACSIKTKVSENEIKEV